MSGLERSYNLSTGYGYTNKTYPPSYGYIAKEHDDTYDDDIIEDPHLWFPVGDDEEWNHEFSCVTVIPDALCDDCIDGKTFYDRESYKRWKEEHPW